MKRPNWKKYRKMVTLRNIFEVLYILGAVAGFVGFFYLIGIVGHSDLESEAGYYEEVWSILEYVKHLIKAFIIMGVGALSFMLGDYYENVTSEWINRFESRWNIHK